jgi:hypothetical protein
MLFFKSLLVLLSFHDCLFIPRLSTVMSRHVTRSHRRHRAMRRSTERKHFYEILPLHFNAQLSNRR